MVKHNNVLPNVHLRKWWQRYVKTWFNQAGRKESRRKARVAKAARISPRPIAGLLRPAVHPPTQRYNLKVREGRGFTLDELKAAKISKKVARSVGISVDHRRRNKCEESLKMNADRLAQYQSKLVVFPRGSKARKGDTPRSELKDVKQNTCKTILPLPEVSMKVKSRAIVEEDKATRAVYTLRQAWKLAKDQGKIFKIKKARAEKERQNA